MYNSLLQLTYSSWKWLRELCQTHVGVSTHCARLVKPCFTWSKPVARGAVVHAGLLQDRNRAKILLEWAVPQSDLIDKAYMVVLEDFVYSTYNWVLLIVHKMKHVQPT